MRGALLPLKRKLGISPTSAAAAARKKTVVVGMSGGVDSSVAAHILKQQGFNVIGAYMRNWDSSDEIGEKSCTTDADWQDVQSVCNHLQIPCHLMNFTKEYWHSVFSPSLDYFSQGYTPNPDALCNVHIKFGEFREKVMTLFNADFIATGHYARLNILPNSTPQLLTAVDQSKDQSYFLASVPRESLRNVLFPIGNFRKDTVRSIAKQAGFVTAAKRDSVGICFIGKRRKFGNFLGQYLEPTPGIFVCGETGKILGEHNGVELFTIGQKAKIPNMSERWYVSEKTRHKGQVVVVPGNSHPALMSDGLIADALEFKWREDGFVKRLLDGESLEVKYKVRYRYERGHGVLRVIDNLIHLDFLVPERAITPRQVLAAYAGPNWEVCIGGGPILRAKKSYSKEIDNFDSAHSRALCM